MPRLVQEAKRDHDLDRIPPSKEYKTHLQKRIRRKKLDGDAVLNWMDDATPNAFGSGGKPADTISQLMHWH